MSAPSKSLTRLAKDVYLAKGASLGTSSNAAAAAAVTQGQHGPKLVILLGWMDAQLKHLTKYVDQYHVMYPDTNVLIVQTHQRAFWSRQSYLQTRLEPVVQHLNQEFPQGIKPDHESPILVHTFSNGGCFALKTIQELWIKQRREYTGIENDKTRLLSSTSSNDASSTGVPARAFIFDSCPGTSSLAIMVRAFTAPIRQWWFKIPASGLVALSYFVIRFINFIKRQPDVLTRTSRFIQTQIPPRPRLYLYSQTDLLIPAKDVERHGVEAQTKQDVDVTMVDFGKSQHVSHARTDKDKYWTSVKQLWTRASER
ncbi:hypothetical protein OIO90_004294 [Microbotryomycetes sp. JL221]|nr:hypothetical protein OIO90_004294 [Microbotryomycetes sp. JL221]